MRIYLINQIVKLIQYIDPIVMLYKSKTKEMFNIEFVVIFWKDAVEQMIKYIVLGDYQIDLSKINDNN